MGKPFFTGWAIWEKLVFCLACAIILTVLAGAIKLAYMHWRLRKYAAVAEKEKQEQSLHRQMSQRKPRKATLGNDEVPFGIRALESGIEVDGVWISRPNTPDSSARQSSTASPTWEHLPQPDHLVDLEKQLPQRHSRAISGSSLTSSRPTSSSQDRVVVAEKLPRTESSRESSPDAHVTKPARTRHPPCSYSRYSEVVYQQRPSPTMSASEGLEAIRRASTSINADMGSSGSSESDQSGNDVDSIAASAPRLFTTDDIVRPRQHSVDLELLNSHRMSQAAEIGQLMPRARKPGGSCDSSSITLPTPAVFAGEPVEYFTSRQKVPLTPSAGSSPTNPFSTPTVEALPASVRRSSMPDVTPFTEFCQNTPRSPRPNGYRSSSTDSTTRSRVPSDLSLYTTAPAHPAPIEPPATPESTETGKPAVQAANHTPFEKRESQVLRGHGTGFEVLRPGTFEPPPSVVHPLERQKAGPPVSLQNSKNRHRSSSSESRKKLQKRRRPSMDSTKSSETG